MKPPVDNAQIPVTEVKGRVVDVMDLAEGARVVLVDGLVTTVLALAKGQQPPTTGMWLTGQVLHQTAETPTMLAQWQPQGTPTAAWDPLGDGTRWSRAGHAPPRLRLLWQRQVVLRALRQTLWDWQFLEIESPLLVPGGCPDAVIASVETTDGNYLVTSTEYQLKRLLVGGVERLYSLGKNFRAGEQSWVHSPEFTMLEWARAWQPLEAIEQDAEALVRTAFHALHPGETHCQVAGRQVEIAGGPWQRLTVRDGLQRYLGVTVDAQFSLPSMLAGAAAAGIEIDSSFQDDAHMVVSILLDRLQGHLGAPVPTFLRDWPAFMTSSAGLDDGNPAIAQRSELYIAGLEIADGFPFLRDAALQAAGFARETERRRAANQPEIRVDDRYVAALAQGIPPGAGMALGVDRLVMVLTGATSIADVLPFATAEL